MLARTKSPYALLRDALAWRLRRALGDELPDRMMIAAARRWRPFLRKPVFVGIGGSVGKTTTKELLVGILSLDGRGTANPASLNALAEVAKTLLRARPRHSFCVAELSEDKPGLMDAPLALLKPHIGIVTVAGNDHSSVDYPREAIAREMGKLIASLPPNGTAVLNADDDRVLAMAENGACRVITYGTTAHAALRAEHVSANWPDRLRMTVTYEAERVAVRTQLCGAHWASCVLAAIGGGLAAGLTLTECAEGIADVTPFDGRMQEVTTVDGVSFVRDDFKAPLWTVDSCLAFLQSARAVRKFFVVGELSDVGHAKGRAYAKIARKAQQVADVVVCVGPWASSAIRARAPEKKDSLLAFSHVREAAEYIKATARQGDLVLLKGTNRKDHLLRIILAQQDDVACWRDDCDRVSFCNECPHRLKPSGMPVPASTLTTVAAASPQPPLAVPVINPDEQVIVGLGNPGSAYANTPHNVGYEVVDRLADSWGLTWDTGPEALIARGCIKGTPVSLIKIQMAMNHTGIGLKKLSETMAFTPEQCVLVFDDLELPLGVAKARMKGGAGGHRGVGSVLEAFQSDNFRRIKIGVGKEGEEMDRTKYVLTPLDEADRASVELAISAAQTRCTKMIQDAAIAAQRPPPVPQ